jgi:hypothetical protein
MQLGLCKRIVILSEGLSMTKAAVEESRTNSKVRCSSRTRLNPILQER